MNTLDLPWQEKYRPKSLSEVIGQKAIVQKLASFAEKGNFPSMIFAGTAGVGKTSCALAMARDLYGDNIGSAFKELNASVTPDTPILIRCSGKMERTTIGEVASRYFDGQEGKYAYPTDLEVLSLDKKTLKVGFMPVKNISRHKVSRIRKIRFESGEVKTTLDHSIIALDANVNPTSVKAGDLKVGDLLITFKSLVKGDESTTIDVSKFAPNQFVTSLRGGKFRNPKIRAVLDKLEVDRDISWFFGSYMAEGVTGFRTGTNTSGITVLTYAYPKESEFARRSSEVVNRMGFTTGMHTIISGSSHRESGLQMTASSTQLAKFFRSNFYTKDAVSKTAHYKKIPGFVFDFPLELRHEFLKGYSGDASGEWDDTLRYTSVSKSLLIDVAWLARISKLDSFLFDREVRITWKKQASCYAYSELISAEPFINFLSGIEAGFNWRYELRHSLYYKKSKRVEKQLIKFVLERVKEDALTEEKLAQLERLKMLASSDICSFAIKDLEDADYEGYVYDVSVPGSEMFWGGTTPVLLHNSDSRGIDVIRGEVKEFAKTISLAKVPVKIIFLDEADALTADAQHALRRTMEKYSAETRFILSANYASKIIEPIQSRCVVFRFKQLDEEEMREYIQRVAKAEKLQIDDKGVEALIYVGDGDLRKISNILQSAAMQGTKITESEIYDIAARARPKEIASMLRYAVTGDFENARKELDNLSLSHGMSAEDILTQCYKEVQGLNVDERAKLKIIVNIGECNFRVVEGANERIQLESMLANIALIGKEQGK
ncbi:MAG TPA: replication factor C small subunit [Candidatus Acidoferrum sp.]|nr:replication factor C small subunit [Candidatus Acidoferrum sp.]